MLYSRVLESNQLVSVAWPCKRKKNNYVQLLQEDVGNLVK